MTSNDSPAARLSLAAGALSLALALIGALTSQFLDPGATLRVLRVLIWVVAAFAVLGIVLGVAGGLKGAARAGTLLSAVTGLLLAAFVTYSGFSLPSSATSAPTDNAAPSGG